MMAKDAIINYLPVTTVIALLSGAVWINSNLATLSSGIALLSEKMDHSNQIQDVRMKATEDRMTRLEGSDEQRREIRQWIIEFKAMNPEIRAPEVP
jgi:hypothetical protein